METAIIKRQTVPLDPTSFKAKTKEFWRRFKRNKPSLVALGILTIILVLGIAAPFIVPYFDITDKLDATQRLKGPSAEHWFGTDAMGRDLFGRVIHGIRYSVSIGIIVSMTITLIGCFVGVSAAYFGGIWDMLVMRFCDIFMCIPGTLFTLTLVMVLGTGYSAMMTAMIISGIPGCAIVMRSLVLNIVRQEYIEAAKAIGVRPVRMVFVHIVPNAMGPIFLNAAMSIAANVMAIAGLGFLGVGVQEPTPEWGTMVSSGLTYILRAPHMVLIPGMFIALTSLSFNLLGDGLADALDPKLKD